MIVSCNATRATLKPNRNSYKSLSLYVYHLRLAMRVEFYTQPRAFQRVDFVGRERQIFELEAAIKRFKAGL